VQKTCVIINQPDWPNDAGFFFLLSDLLKHDKLLSNKAIPAHLRDVPEYLIDAKTKEASNVVKLTRAAMGLDKPQRRKGQGFKGGSGKSRDPLKTFSAEVYLSI
jgi:ATP-dependent RNA helicase DDX56/DBP9